MKLVLLPGLDGTGRLFDPLLQQLPAHLSPIVIKYPADQSLSYSELLLYVREKIPLGEEYVVLAESFSGPLAIELAASEPTNLKGLILCATFASNPTPLPHPSALLVRWPAFTVGFPNFIVRRYLLGKNAPDSLVKDFHDVLRSVLPEVLACRVRSVLKVDVRTALNECRVPILFLAATKDRLAQSGSLQEMKSLKPDIQIVEIDGPHLLLQREPVKCIAAMDQFVRGLERSDRNDEAGRSNASLNI